MTEQEFNVLKETHDTIAIGGSSATMSCVSVLGNKLGTPIAMSFMSQETDGNLTYVALSVPVTINQ